MVRQFVGDKDIFMLNAVVDIAGHQPHQPDRAVAGGAGDGRARDAIRRPAAAAADKPLVAATMFGVTTPCVERARDVLERAGYEVLVFHATGNGGQAMESLDRRRPDRRRARPHDDRARRRARRRLPQRRPGRLTAAGASGHSPGRLDRRRRHGELLRAVVGAREVQGPGLLPPQRQRHADADDAGRERRDRRGHRAEAVGGDAARSRCCCRRAASRRSIAKGSRSTIRRRGGRCTRRSAQDCPRGR